MSDKMIKVGITHGDINGISYELILKTFEDNRIYESCVPIIYGSSKVLAYHRKLLNLPSPNISTINTSKDAGHNRLNIINCGNEDVAVELAKLTEDSSKLEKLALERAVEDLKSGLIDTLLTAPSTQEETSFLTEKIGNGKDALNILVNDSFRVALASGQMPLADVSSYLTSDLLAARISALHSSLVHDFMITLPRIAVLSLNPGMGIKEQRYGREENEVVIPAIKSAADMGITCFGPYSADDFFGSDDYMKFDAVLAMYYDQGIIPFRAISLGRGAYYTANLPFIRIASEHGVSYEKAGKNEIFPDSLRNALYLALDIFRNRKLDEKIYSNPLKKQYFEKGSDNEKLDLTKEE